MLGVIGESRCETDGLGGNLRLGKVAMPGGADMGTDAVKGLGGTIGAVAGGESLMLALDIEVVGEERSDLYEQSDCSLASISGRESGVVSPEAIAGEFNDMALERKSV